MSRVIIILFVFFLFVGVSVTFGQTCTPVRMGKDANYSETTPGISFVVDSASYNQETTITLTNQTVMSIAASYFGYVNVRPGFGGCTQSWNITGFDYYYGLYDLTEGRWVFDSPQQPFVQNQYCGPVASCRFYDEGGYYVVNIIPGHNYHFWAFVSMSTSVGQSAWEDDYLTINNIQ